MLVDRRVTVRVRVRVRVRIEVGMCKIYIVQIHACIPQ
jgi:hypothetical protein